MNLDSEPVSVWRKNLKRRATALFGNKCCVCGYNRCLAALEFHHLDPSKKDFSISSAYASPKKWATIVQELEKCVLVCSNCHREIHHDILYIENKNYIVTDKDYRITEKTHHKCSCGEVILLSKKYCSPECSAKGSMTRDWFAEKDTILHLRDIEKLSYVAIAKRYNTSDNTIRKWYLIFVNS